MQSDDPSENMRPERIIEWALAIILVSVLLGLSFFAWKRGSDRAGCIMNIRNVQQAIRGWEGMTCQREGVSPINWSTIIGPAGYMPEPTCPAGGTYRFKETLPEQGVLAMECSLCDAPQNHKPGSFADW